MAIRVEVWPDCESSAEETHALLRAMLRILIALANANGVRVEIVDE